MGFDGLGVNEHHQNAYGLMPSPNIMAAALARRTSHANLVVLGNSIALYNPPVRVAEEFAMLDVLCGGRLVAGFPVGTSMDTNFCYGEIPALSREVLRGPRSDHQAWNEEELFAFNGKFTKLRYVNLWPRPLQQPHPPIWIPGGGSVETWDFVDDTYQYSFLSFSGYLAGSADDGYWDVCRRGLKEPLQPRLRADDRRRRDRRAGRARLRAPHGLLLQPLPARLSGLRRRAGLSHTQHHQDGMPASRRTPRSRARA